MKGKAVHKFQWLVVVWVLRLSRFDVQLWGGNGEMIIPILLLVVLFLLPLAMGGLIQFLLDLLLVLGLGSR